MPTSTDEERAAPDGEPPAAEPRSDRMLSGRTAVVAVAVASVATVGVVVASLMIDDDRSAPTAQAPVTVGQRPPSAAEVQPPPPPAPPAQRPAVAPAPATDDRGFVNSAARCEGPQRAVAVGRTARSVVVVCRGPDGRYEYTGARLSDGAVLRLDDVRATPQGFEARGGGATYLVSANELVAMSGDAVLTRDAMIAYRTPDPAR